MANLINKQTKRLHTITNANTQIFFSPGIKSKNYSSVYLSPIRTIIIVVDIKMQFFYLDFRFFLMFDFHAFSPSCFTCTACSCLATPSATS
jgi:hypothetical protein